MDHVILISNTKIMILNVINWRDVVHFDDLSQQNDPAQDEMLLTEAFLGHVQIRPSAVKWLNFGKFLFFFEFPLFWCSYT